MMKSQVELVEHLHYRRDEFITKMFERERLRKDGREEDLYNFLL